MDTNCRHRKFLLRLLYLFILLLFIFPNQVSASDQRTVKVAFFPMDGFHITNPDGSYGGMDVEYLEALCEYANWEIEYITCDSWEDALTRLENKQVDLVGSAQYSKERSKIFDYADLSSGYTFGVIATNPESTIAYEDFSAMKDITFGLVKNYVRKNDFLDYLSDNGIKQPQIEEYESTAQLHQALDDGEVDAFVHTLTEVMEGQRVIGRFAPKPFYYITYKGNGDVLRELNQALADLKIDYPDLESELINRFFQSRLDKTNLLTLEEKKYIASEKSVTVGYLDGYYPFSYEKEGEFCGLARELLQESVEAAGLTLNYQKLENEQEAEAALSDGTIQLLAYYTCTDPETAPAALYNYAEIPLVLVRNKEHTNQDISILATTNALEYSAKNLLDLQDTTLVICNSQQKCLDTLQKGDADAALCGSYLAEYLLQTELQYGHLSIKTVLNDDYTVYMALSPHASSILDEILTKTLSSINDKTINDYMLRENTSPLVSLQQLIYRYSIPLILVMLVFIIIIICVAYHLIQDARKIQKLLYKDTTLDIWNSNYLIFRGEQKLLPERKKNYALIGFNISQFRRYNIIYGWNSGEIVLEIIAKTLLQCVDARHEICARSQGDRFVLLLEWDDWNVFLLRLQKIQQELEGQIFRETDNHMQLQLGVYPIPEGENDLHRAMNYANQALEVIGNSNDTLKIYDAPFEAMLKERHEREKVLEAADVWSDFVVYYQNKVDIRTEKIVGAEALVRFRDPTANGLIRSPGYFVPYYEKTGKITEIDFFVLESVCKMLRKRIDSGKKVVTVSCNFSRMHFVKPEFADHFEEVLAKYNISKDLIEVEITETLVVEELQQQAIKETIDILREKNIRLSIDDFGAGYSSLGVFEQIPASVVKLDRSFLLNQENKERQVKIMRGIVQMAETLQAQVVCEGVENLDDVNLMKEIHAYIAQGYYYSKPIPEDAFEEQLDVQYPVA